MKSLIYQLQDILFDIFTQEFADQSFEKKDFSLTETKAEFEGDYTLVLFPFLKTLRTNPNALGQQVGEELIAAHGDKIASFEIVSGFLNLSLTQEFLKGHFQNLLSQENFDYIQLAEEDRTTIMVEYSSPNTNKPLHFGHLRNIFLGWSVAEILKANGHKVIKSNLINDRGIHICKSMLAWQILGEGKTPESTNIKGDHFVGDYYVAFNDLYKKEIADLVADGMEEAEAEKEAPILKKAQEMLVAWENGDKEVIDLWKKMNQWVYDGFDITYDHLGVDFDKFYYESDTYLLGKDIVEDALAKELVYQKEDQSIWIDLEEEKLDHKLLLRGDGTSVYITQDLGTARLKYNEYQLDKSIYVIADEQNYHMQVLKESLKKLGEDCAEGIYHLSYGMVELPHGRMKSREGTVVDADDMYDEMLAMAKEQTENSGKTEGFTEEELAALYKTIGLGSLKFYLLRVEPRRKMIFNPEESIDLHGFTAAFIQYAHARINSIIRRSGLDSIPSMDNNNYEIQEAERALVLQLEQLPFVVQAAGKDYNPGLLANYSFKLAQLFNSFFDKHSVLQAESEEAKNFRLNLADYTAKVLRYTMAMLGINLPERM